MKTLSFIFLLCSLIFNIQAQNVDYKAEAINASKVGNFKYAIELLQKAKIENPNDPEVYYYLGVFMHYLAYDSTPLAQYDSTYTNKVIPFFKKAIELKPDYGDAFYFIGAQYGAEASDAMQNGSPKGYKKAFKEGYDAGGYPDWLLEYDKNILKSCDSNAILFVGGDAEFDPIQYLQVVESYRKDITVIPFGFLDRPWYIKAIKEGFGDIIRKAPLGISENQIMDLHNYKWDTLTVNISISNKLKKEYKLSSDDVMKWQIIPDLTSGDRTFLSVKRAILFNIIQANKWERPVYFSLGCWPSFYDGLGKYLQLSGVAFKLLPVAPEKIISKIDAAKVEEVLLNKNNIKNFYDVKRHNMPRASNVLENYYVVLYNLVDYYKGKNQLVKIEKLKNYIKNYLDVNFFPFKDKTLQAMDKLLKK